MEPLPANHPNTSQPIGNETSLTSATLLVTFGIGRSYIFYAAKNPKKSWQKRFPEDKGWDFKKFEGYSTPLGETVTLKFSRADVIKKLKRAYDSSLLAELDDKHIEVSFFTTGVAVLVLRLTARSVDGPVSFLNRIQDKEKRKKTRKLIESIVELCTEDYLAVLDKAERDTKSFFAKQDWSLRRFKKVDRKNWKPKSLLLFPLFFLTDETYKARMKSILEHVSSLERRRRQSQRAKVSYEGTEIYVDWSEALIKSVGGNRQAIETNFIIALCSWNALVLMTRNSSVFLLEAFAGMVEEKHRSNADEVHQRHMAYKDVCDASLPIRWTMRRRDLFLLETIDRNWSSERWRKNIGERMKMLTLHYKSLEDESNERSSRTLARAATMLALFTIAGAIADIIDLAENDDQLSHWNFLGYPLKSIDVQLSLVPVLIAILVTVWWVWRWFSAKYIEDR